MVNKGSNSLKTLIFSLIIVITLFCTGCEAKKAKRIVLWTSSSDFASYVELFNASQDKYKVILVYKDEISTSFPPAKDELKPDIVVGSWLKNEKTHKYFSSMNFFLYRLQKKSTFYPKLLESGKIKNKQYFLPVSFNLPLMIFSKANNELIPNEYTLSVDEVKSISKDFNVLNADNSYSIMGFSPRWSSSFMYTVSKLKGADYKESGNTFVWNQDSLNQTIDFFKNWSTENNTSSMVEDDFSFKYLYTPEYKYVSSKKCLFAYTTSDELFNIHQEKLEDIDYRYLSEDNKIPIIDRLVHMGIYKKSHNKKVAKAFIYWFMDENTQRNILERQVQMKLNTTKFGIAGGFSGIQTVNEQIFPFFYPILQGNLPPSDYLDNPQILPSQWESIREKIIIPYLEDATNTRLQNSSSIEERIINWNKQNF